MVKRTVWPRRAEVDVSVPFACVRFTSVLVIDASRTFHRPSGGITGGMYEEFMRKFKISPYALPLLFSTTARK